MIPLRDSNPSRTIPVVNYALIAGNLAVFVYQLILGPRLEGFFLSYGIVPRQFFADLPSRFLDPGLYLPFLSSQFLHGGFLHLGGNMLTLWIFGDNVEDRLGHARYLLFYLGAGLAAGAAHVLLNARSPLPSIGASGAIAGVMGAYVVWFPHARVLTMIPIFIFIQFVEIPAVFYLGFWFLMQFFSGTMSLGDAQTYQQGGVAWWAHIGGFATGLAAGFIVRARDRRRPFTWR
jgi:hypothetical protein